MGNAQESIYENWRQMDYEWRRAQERWQDSTTEYFKGYYIKPLEFEMKNYLHAIDNLMEILREAQQASRHY